MLWIIMDHYGLLWILMDHYGSLWIILRLAPEESVTSDHSHSEDSECFTEAQRAEVRPGHQSWKLRWSAMMTTRDEVVC